MLKQTVYISSDDQCWCTHTEEGKIGNSYVLKSTALALAVKHVASMQQDMYDEIQVQCKNGTYKTVWNAETDSFPPGKIPLKKNKFM